MKNTVIIVAGGAGTRMGSTVPKQFLLISGKPVLMHTIEKFITFDNSLDLIVTLPENQIETWKNLCLQYKFNHSHKVVIGGFTRFHSVQNALAEVAADSEIVAVHDGVRPLVSIETIKKCFEIAESKGNAIPVIQVNESIRRISGNESEIVNRDGICIVQTPQVFRYAIIISAYRQAYAAEFTDDASVVEKSGCSINFIDGNRENIKITFPADIVFAEKLMQSNLHQMQR
jgi:2-C-methyl-D-erythritol 4-phosphate cytidylyltransferase